MLAVVGSMPQFGSCHFFDQPMVCSFCLLLYIFCAEEFHPIISILKKAVLEQLTPKLLRRHGTTSYLLLCNSNHVLRVSWADIVRKRKESVRKNDTLWPPDPSHEWVGSSQASTRQSWCSWEPASRSQMGTPNHHHHSSGGPCPPGSWSARSPALLLEGCTQKIDFFSVVLFDTTPPPYKIANFTLISKM